MDCLGTMCVVKGLASLCGKHCKLRPELSGGGAQGRCRMGDAFAVDAETAMERHAFARGCLVGNLGQEMGALPEAFRQQLSDVFADWQHRTAQCLRAAQAAGEIGAHHDADRLAAFFWIGWEGAVLRAKLERSGAPLRTFAEGFLAMIRT